MKYTVYTGLSLILTLFLADFAAAQQCSEEETDFNTYYYRKATLFELLENDKDEIIFLGDSITDSGSWAEMFNDSAIKNRGISGDVTLGVLCRIDEVVESKPEKVFLMIGVNDLARGIAVEGILSNYGQIIGEIKSKSPGTELYLQSVLPVNPDFEMFENHMKAGDQIPKVNKGIKELAKESGATYINLYPEFSTNSNKLNPEYTNDGLHLIGQGYMVWQSLIRQYVND